jgi:DNA-binding transcriptional LysR family regulator
MANKKLSGKSQAIICDGIEVSVLYSSNRSLYCFVVAAEELNFTRAAEKLFMTQQALSSHIKKLEQQYDAVLFERRPRLCLTPAGHHLLSYAKNTIQNERSLIKYLQDDRKNSIG